MLDALRFVAPSVAKKDFVPELTHYRIADGRVTGYNGVIALSSKIDVDLDIHPNATKFMAAINACPDTITLNMTPAGKLAVRSGKFRSFVDCLEDNASMFVEPEGEEIDLGENFLKGIRAIAPVMGVDASRPWAMGVKLQGQSMFATNNVMLAEYWHGTAIPLDVVIPAAAVEELLRIGQEPTRVQVTKNSLSFWFGEDRWMRTALVESGPWPTDKIGQILGGSTGEQTKFPEGFFDAVDKLVKFAGEHGTIFMTEKSLSTSTTEGEGTSIEIDLPSIDGMHGYHFKQLQLLGKVAVTVDWTSYPAPCMFVGDKMRGAVVGQRVNP